ARAARAAARRRQPRGRPARGAGLELAQRAAEENLAAPAPTEQRADRQTDLSEGVARVSDSLYTLAAKTPFISPKLGQALGRAMEGLSSSGKDLASGNRQRGEESGREGSDAL